MYKFFSLFLCLFFSVAYAADNNNRFTPTTIEANADPIRLRERNAMEWFNKLSDAEKEKVDERYKAYVTRTDDFTRQMQASFQGLDPNEPMYYAARQAIEHQQSKSK